MSQSTPHRLSYEASALLNYPALQLGGAGLVMDDLTTLMIFLLLLLLFMIFRRGQAIHIALLMTTDDGQSDTFWNRVHSWVLQIADVGEGQWNRKYDNTGMTRSYGYVI